MNKNGYTIIEMTILCFVVGIIAIISINKVSYAFNNEGEISLRENAFSIIEEEAKNYGNNNLKAFKDKKEIYIDVEELVKSGYLVYDENNLILGFNDLADKKIKITYDEEKINAIVLNKE